MSISSLHMRTLYIWLNLVSVVVGGVVAPVFPGSATLAFAADLPSAPPLGARTITLPFTDWEQGDIRPADLSSRDTTWLRLRRATPSTRAQSSEGSGWPEVDITSMEGVSLASADFDADGILDLACGFEKEGAGIVTLQTGRIALDDEIPYSRRALAFEAPVPPELMAAGDFDADGSFDLVVARRGDSAFYLLRGNGSGVFVATRTQAVDGRITALTSGDVDCRDGLADLALGLLKAEGPSIAVFSGPQGALAATPDLFPVDGAVRALEVGDVTDGPGADVAALLDVELVAVAGNDERVGGYGARRLGLRLSIEGVSMALERTADGRAALTVVNSQGNAVTCTAEAWSTKRAWKPRSDVQLASGGFALGANITSLPGCDLVALAHGDRRLAIVPPIGGTPSWIELPERVAVVLPLRLNGDALDDLVVLYKSGAAPDVLLTAPQNIYVVTTTNNDGPGALASAINLANANPGPDAIHFAIPGTAPFNINWAMMNVLVTEALTIDATTQPGYAGSPVVRVSGSGNTYGLRLTGGSTAIRGLAITQFSSALSIEAVGNVVEGNYIGLDVDGVTTMGNTGFGISVLSSGNSIGGTTSQSRNVISGNGNSGIYIFPGTSGNVVAGNYIGTNAAGAAARPNSRNGVEMSGVSNVIGGTSAGAGNVISGNGLSGIETENGPNMVQGNIVGLAADGATALSNGYIGVFLHDTGHLIGGSTDSARNVISANRYGVLANDTHDSVIQGNYLGTDVTGSLDRGNQFDGIEVGGPSCQVLDNLISGNDRYGVSGDVTPAHSLILRNRIGTDTTGTLPVPNASVGVRIDGDFHTVEDNTIAFNGYSGILVYGGVEPKYNGLHRNSIFSNGLYGIELVAPEGNDPLDADRGANLGQNYPALYSAVVDATGTTVTGFLTSAPMEIFTVELFSSPEPTSAVARDAKTYLGAMSVSTNAVGRADFTARLPIVPEGRVVSATATDSLENTSEISPFRAVTASAPDPAYDAIGVYVPSTAAWFLRNTATPGNADVVFGYGPPLETPLAGDWDGTLDDTAGIYDPSSSAFFLNHANSGGSAENVLVFGATGAGFVPLCGDWDGDGITTIGLYLPSSGAFFLRNALAPGPADVVFTFGAGGGVIAIAGDWDGDGADSVGIYDPATGAFFLANSLAPGPAALVFSFGPPGGTPVTGDWDGDGDDTVGVYFPGSAAWFLTNSHAPGPADVSVVYGPLGATPVTGNWDGQ